MRKIQTRLQRFGFTHVPAPLTLMWWNCRGPDTLQPGRRDRTSARGSGKAEIFVAGANAETLP
jgi:hypothetical protein